MSGLRAEHLMKRYGNRQVLQDVSVQVEPGEVVIEAEGKARRARLASTGEPVVIGDAEKMSKSKKNTVSPGEIIEVYGVDAARLFVLSDSPPERDAQWPKVPSATSSSSVTKKPALKSSLAPSKLLSVSSPPTRASRAPGAS